MGNGAQLKRRTSSRFSLQTVLLSVLAASPAAAATCISLQNSTLCPAFNASSISTDSTLVGLYPFLEYVSDVASFDEELLSYVQTSYVNEKYVELLGCGDISLTNTSDLYARFTITVLCNGIVQNSIDVCNLTAAESRPVCADTCAEFAESEEYIVADSELCTNPSSNALQQIRADFTNCALPADSLSSSECIEGITNEPENCGYANNTVGLCSYCESGGINSTDTCCYSSDAQSQCSGVVLPTITPTMTFGTPTATASSTTSAAHHHHGLSGGDIAGVVVGSVAGAALLAALAVFGCLFLKRRKQGSQAGSIFNQPSPARRGPSISQAGAPQGYEVLPGGRIARMSALEGHSGGPSSRHEKELGAAAVGAAAGYAAGRRRDDNSSSDGFGDSPGSVGGVVGGVLRPPPSTGRRNGSLSSNSVLAGEDPQSPTSAGGMSSPQGMASQQSEQLPFFKDYYSQDDIHPGDRVAVLWAYQPRAVDEFALERGDMLKVVGIWDDGWATGVVMDERAEDWDGRRQAQRDSGVSNTSGRGRDVSLPGSGEIKAFPLVCVCLPEHWKKTIEGDGSTDTASTAAQKVTAS